jgi:glucose-6-phosphate isomerase
MPILQSIENARDGAQGVRDGVKADVMRRMLERAHGALEKLRAQHADGSLPLLRLPERTDDLAAIDKTAALLKGANDVVMLGTGGSSLGGQTLAQLAGYGISGVAAFRQPPHLHFMDNLDGASFAALLNNLPLKTARFAAISKSGGTGETLMQTIAVLSALKKAGFKASDHMVGLTEPAKSGKKNGLRDLLAAHHVHMMEHDTGVGGRFSALTNVGLLPAAVLGLDIAAIRQGAAAALAPILEKKPAAEVPSALGAALNVAMAEQGKSIAVMMAYADRLERFTKWYVQLWAESLGKDGKGTTPVAALGPVDQHSQLQLYLAGPRDKLFTVVTTDNQGGPRLDDALSQLAGEDGLSGKTIGDLVVAQGRATADTLAKNGCPVRTIHLPKIDQASLGELLMHFMLETIIAAHLIGVDAFDQPAVEEGKVLAKKYLAGKS